MQGVADFLKIQENDQGYKYKKCVGLTPDYTKSFSLNNMFLASDNYILHVNIAILFSTACTLNLSNGLCSITIIDKFDLSFRFFL